MLTLSKIYAVKTGTAPFLVGSFESGVGSLDTRYWILDARFWILTSPNMLDV